VAGSRPFKVALRILGFHAFGGQQLDISCHPSRRQVGDVLTTFPLSTGLRVGSPSPSTAARTVSRPSIKRGALLRGPVVALVYAGDAGTESERVA
jgi:hypothetical protein